MADSTFVAIDVETANADMSSVCQVGIATFVDGKLSRKWQSLVDPEDYFDGMNVSIHGIDERRIKGAPKFPEILPSIVEAIGNRIVVSHTHFDRSSLLRAAEKYRLTMVSCQWLDSARVVRRAWSQYSKSGYGLGSVCADLGIQFQHHDALEDARAAGEVLLRAIDATGLSLKQWVGRVQLPIQLDANGAPLSIAQAGDSAGALAGEEIVFTGSLSITRKEAASFAAKAGCDVAANVTKATTLLVVGDQDVIRLAGNTKSAKHRKAEELLACGQNIRILRESDFLRLLSDATIK